MEDKNQIIMTEGKPMPILIRFSIPLVLSAFFQQLYSFIDSMIVGRCISVDALAAVNLTFSLNFVIMGITMGSALGFCVPFAQAVGAKNKEDMNRYFWNGLYLSIGLSLLGSVLAVPFTRQLLQLINTPDNLLSMSIEYLRIILIGLAATTLYNYFAGIMRALGDSKHPFYFLLIASGVNLVLDLAFIVIFHMGVAGAAIATILSQMVSGLFCVRHLVMVMRSIHATGENGENYRRISGSHIRTLCVIGLPMGLELSVNGIGSVVLQSCVNQMGSVVVAAVAAGEKIRSMLTLPMENLGTAMSTYAAQNYGARKYHRIYDGIKSAVIILLSYCVFAWVLVLLLKKPLVYLLLGTMEGDIADHTVLYLALISTLFFFHGALQVFRNIVQGMGHSTAAVVSGGMEILGRVIGGTLAVHYASFKIICVSNPLAWIFAGGYCVVMTFYFLGRISKKEDSGHQ